MLLVDEKKLVKHVQKVGERKWKKDSCARNYGHNFVYEQGNLLNFYPFILYFRFNSFNNTKAYFIVMGSLLQDRLSAILFFIEQWRNSDPNLEHKDGFLNYLSTCDIGYFSLGNSKVWMNYYKEAKKQGITIPELLFEKQREILSLQSA